MKMYIPFGDWSNDGFIWLLNVYGARIEKCDEDYPMICNWNCKGFKTVGYGCFYG